MILLCFSGVNDHTLASEAIPAPTPQSELFTGSTQGQVNKLEDKSQSTQIDSDHNLSLPDQEKLFPKSEKPDASAPLFELIHVSITGLSVFTKAELQHSYQYYIGREVSEQDLWQITETISKIYQDQGYFLSRAIIPAQDIVDGRLNIQVIEGSIEEIDFQGLRRANYALEQRTDKIKLERPLTLKTFERQLMLVNKLSGLSIDNTYLEEIGTASGRFKLTIKVKDWDLWSKSEIDNQGTEGVGPYQSHSTLAFNNLFDLGHTLTFNYSSNVEDDFELGFIQAKYSVPIGPNGTLIGLRLGMSDVKPGDRRRLFESHYYKYFLSAFGSFAPIQMRDEALTLNWSVGMKDVKREANYGLIYHDQLRTASVGGDYYLRDQFLGENYLSLRYVHGFEIFGSSEEFDFDLSRFDARGEFDKLRFYYSRLQHLPGPFSLLFSAKGQVSSEPLLASEEFYIGGERFGRAYDSGIVSGDSGLAAFLELRYNREIGHHYLKSAELYTFVDSGIVWNQWFSDEIEESLSSVGAGVRLDLIHNITADLSVAFPIAFNSPFGNPFEPEDAKFSFRLERSFKLNREDLWSLADFTGSLD